MNERFDLFTSLRYDPQLLRVTSKDNAGSGWNFENESPLYMLNFHRDRMLRAAKHWAWQSAIDALEGPRGLQNLARLIQRVVGLSQATPLRLKVIVSREGDVRCERGDTPEVPLENLLPLRLPPPSPSASKGDPKRIILYTLLVDDEKTPRSEFTHYKTSKRDMYDSARRRAGISLTDLKEVLVLNQHDGSVMEGTITTPYFWRHGQWVTPPVAAEFSWADGSGGQDGTTRRWALERSV